MNTSLVYPYRMFSKYDSISDTQNLGDLTQVFDKRRYFVDIEAILSHTSNRLSIVAFC